MSVGGGGAAEKLLKCALIIIISSGSHLAGELGRETAEARARLEWAMEFLTSQLE